MYWQLQINAHILLYTPNVNFYLWLVTQNAIKIIDPKENNLLHRKRRLF